MGICQVWSAKWSFKCDMWNKTPVSQSARTHGLGWRTAHASSIDEKGLIYIFKATSAPPRAGTTGISHYISLTFFISLQGSSSPSSPSSPHPFVRSPASPLYRPPCDAEPGAGSSIESSKLRATVSKAHESPDGIVFTNYAPSKVASYLWTLHVCVYIIICVCACYAHDEG